MQKVLFFDQPGDLTRSFEFKKEADNLDVLGIVLGQGSQVFSINLVADYLARKTSGKTDFRIVLKDDAVCNFKGRIKIGKAAQQANVFLSARALLLSKNAKVEIDPDLEIEANDVTAGHAATVGKIDPEQIYYLSSRGLDESEAQSLIAQGFLNEIINRIENVKMKKEITLKLQAFL